MIDSEIRRRRRAIQALGAGGGALALLMGGAAALPTSAIEPLMDDLPALFVLLRFLSIMLACLTVTTAWYALRRERSDMAGLMLAGFTPVAGALFLLTLSPLGLLPWLPFSPHVDGFLRVTGRAAEVLTLLAVAARIGLPLSRRAALATGGLVLLAVVALSAALAHETQPEPALLLFTLGWLLSGLHAVAGVAHVWRYLRSHETRHRCFAAACVFAGLAEVALLSHAEGLVRLLAEVSRVFAFVMVYRGVFTASVAAPYARLEQSEATIQRQQEQLNTLLRNVPVGLAQLDRELRYRYVNPTLAHHLHAVPEQLTDTHWRAALPPQWQQPVGAHLHETLEGKRTEFEFEYGGEEGDPRHANAIMVPERADNGAIEGVLAIFTDQTERERARRQLAESVREVSELKAALDAHAIVAVTDANGVITRVNDKFCIISKYRRSELLGSTHRIINSGHHPASFFDNLWKTISSGMVWTGEICNRAKDGSLYWVYTTIVPFVGEEGIPVQYISIRADITERKRAEQEAQHMALYDALTGLPNRRLMGDRLRDAISASQRSGQHGALLLLDLDNFKQINDTLGHDQGDALLQQVGDRLLFSVRQADTVARMGGDEFVIVLSDLGKGVRESALGVEAVSEKIRTELAAPFQLDGLTVNVTGSLGAVLFRGQDEREDKLLKRADMALYRAKAQGRNRLSLFDPALEAAVLSQASLLQDLRQALPRGQLALHAQPIVDQTGRVRSQEMLLRWHHPSRGIVPPTQFIPLAEQHGLILDIGNWVLQQTCALLADWQCDPSRCRWTAAVNVSVRQLRDAGFVDSVRQALQATGAPAHRLRLELTESTLLTDVDETIAKMAELRAMGVHFALDDFGTGYSSLSYLRRLPLDELKIDRSFVADVTDDPNDGVIARTIISLTNSLGLSAVAEGVETAEQFAFLKALGCDAFQGYYFGHPEPVLSAEATA